jgi:hypothetical protein
MKARLLVLMGVLSLFIFGACSKGLSSSEKQYLAETMDVSKGAVEAMYDIIPLKCDKLKDDVFRNICVTQVYGSGSLLVNFLDAEDKLDISLKDVSKDDLQKKMYDFLDEKVIDTDRGLSGYSVKVEDKYKVTHVNMRRRSVKVETMDKVLDLIEKKLKDITSEKNWAKDTSIEKLGKIAEDLLPTINDKINADLDEDNKFYKHSSDGLSLIIVYYMVQKVLISQGGSGLGDAKKRCERIEDLIVNGFDASMEYMQHHSIAADYAKMLKK